MGQRHTVRPVRTGLRRGPLTLLLKGYFNSNLGGTLYRRVSYRISIFQGFTREGESKALKEHKGTSRKAPVIDRETDFFKDLFGPTTSPIVREVTQGGELVVDLDKESPAANQAQSEKRKRERQQSSD